MKPWEEMGELVVHTLDEHEESIKELKKDGNEMKIEFKVLAWKVGTIIAALTYVLNHLGDVAHWIGGTK